MMYHLFFHPKHMGHEIQFRKMLIYLPYIAILLLGNILIKLKGQTINK